MKIACLILAHDNAQHLQRLVSALSTATSHIWAISCAVCDHILAFAERETQVLYFFKNTQCPDESFFHTILGNSPFLGRTARDLTYTDWSGGASPVPMTQQHLTLFRATSSFPAADTYGAGSMLFARKFSDQWAQLVARIDARPSSLSGVIERASRWDTCSTSSMPRKAAGRLDGACTSPSFFAA